MDVTFGAINRTSRADSVEMSTYFRNAFLNLSLSRPSLFLGGPFGIATACHVHGDSYRSAGIFQDSASKVLVAFNGDIVDLDELQCELRTVGLTGPTGIRSCEELVYKMYTTAGPGFALRLNGVANVAIWHEREGKLILISDPFGFKPFYYFDDGSTFVFASSIKAILQHPAVPRAVNADALHELMAVGFVLPPDTLFKGIKIVSPGDYLEFTEIPIIRRLPARSTAASTGRDEDRLAQEYFGLLKNAVSIRVRTADKVAVLLSGGADSSAIVSVLHAIGVRNIDTYSMHPNAGDREELETARTVSQRFGTKHCELTELAPESLKDLSEIIWQLEVPRVEVVAEFALGGFVNCDANLCLTGDGNDIPWGLLSPAFLETSGKSIVELYLLLRRRMTDQDLRALLPAYGNPNGRLADAIAAQSPNTGNIFQDLISLDRRLFGAHFVNRMLGKLRIENQLLAFRFPFLDRHLLDFVSSLPDFAKVRRSDTGRMTFKYLFKRAIEKEGMLPESIIHRKKTWMHHPTAAWFRSPFGAQLERLILKTNTEALAYFDSKHVAQLWREHREGKSDHTHALETILTYLLWHKIFIESKACERPRASLLEIS